ncbi:adenylyltransferase/cytidyltransferase family protein [Patescibacteria group bacterium]|nr:adenylyltransferase/cytidyltransferase family protein [Patescibacteria group bacterium]
MKTVLVFGAFDVLHKGHQSLLEQARTLGDRLIVALAQDEVIKRLKGREVQNDFDRRAKALEDSGLVDEVIPGDPELGSYDVIVKKSPDIIGVGYDQDELKKDLEAWLSQHNLGVKIKILQPFEPEKYKSSRMTKSDL